jgi:electron transfer flavoprotein beta subunit
MRIAVCVKHVPEGRAVSTRRRTVSTAPGEGALNHFDANAVEEALRLKGDSDTEVVAVSLGPQQALDSLARPWRWEPTAPCSSPTTAPRAPTSSPPAVCSPRRSNARRRTSFSSASRPQTPTVRCWAAVAERLRRPVVSQAMELSVDGGNVRVKRQTEFGYDTLEAPLPAVVAVSDAINEPRYPSLKGIMGAKKKQRTSSRSPT